MDTAHLPMMHSRLSHFFRLATPSLVPRRVSILPPVLALLGPPLCSPAPHSGSEDTFFDVTFSDCCCDGTGKPFKLIVRTWCSALSKLSAHVSNGAGAGTLRILSCDCHVVHFLSVPRCDAVLGQPFT